ncbi:MAG: FecCD family ABC transporter permease [Alphaproteobacteria bacterium]
MTSSKLYITGLLITPIIFALIAMTIGRYFVSFSDVFHTLSSVINGADSQLSALTKNVILNIRLPRVIMAMLVGGGLAVAGCAMQSLFANPIATPDTIGVGSGASFGAVLAILLFNNIFAIQSLAFVMGILAAMMTVTFSKLSKNNSIVMIVLAGMIVASFFAALTSLLKTIADTDTELPSIVFWLMGSMAGSSFEKLKYGAAPILLGVFIITALRWKINALLLSEDEIKSMGIHVKRMRMIVLCSATLITASAVSMCGQVGWVGLLIPHLCKLMVGNDNRKVIPFSFSLGASFMLIVDTMARSLSHAEIPLSIITALIGAPFFAFIMIRLAGRWR